MTDYTELVKALRSASTVSTAWEKLMHDAAAAIEELQAEVEELKAKKMKLAENSLRFVGKVRELDKRLFEPKRGKWIIHPEVKNIYGGVYIECPFCGEKYVVQNVSDEKFCRNCGADLRARMEVQE